MNRRIIKPRSYPLRGGCVTYTDALKTGEFSWMQNLRNRYPGLSSRKGQSELNQTADSTNAVLNLYQYKQKYGSGVYTYAQMSDGDLFEFGFDIPTGTTGVIGSVVHEGSSSQIPASFADLGDTMIYSNGVDQHQTFCGTGSRVDQFISDGTLDLTPVSGVDNTIDISSGVATTLTSQTLLYIRSRVPLHTLSWTVDSGNGTSSTATVYYWNGAWTDASVTDGTSSGGASLAQSGDMTLPTVIYPSSSTIDSFSAPGSLPFGLTFDGTNLISVDSTAQTIYIHDGVSGSVTSSFASPGTYPRGLTFDGTNLISSDTDTGLIYIHNGVSSSITSSFSSPSTKCQDLAFDGTNLISADNDTNTIYVHSGVTSSVTDSFSSPGNFPSGLTYVDGNLLSVDYGNGAIYIHDGTTSAVFDSFATPGAGDGKGLAYTGGNLVSADSGDTTIYVHDNNIPRDDIRPKYQYGACGWWYKIAFSAGITATVSGCTFTDDFQDLHNVWSGVQERAVEVQVEGTSQWETYSSGAVDLGGLAAGKKIVIATTDPIEGLFWNPGSTPNATGTTVGSLKYWDGTAFVTVGSVTDGTNGISNAGWMVFPRQPAEPRQFETSLYYAYWYELTFSATISDSTIVAIDFMPYFDVSDFGLSGRTSTVWRDRACYSFDQYGAYIYASTRGSPTVLNGIDYGILQAGDGRANRITAMRQFYNELMVWQEEKGTDGGCVTIFEGYSPQTFGKLVLTDKIGGMNNKSVAVVDGVQVAMGTEETLRTMAYFLSRYGVCVTDGRTVSVVSDDIANYFDPQESDCIRAGYEDEMWLYHDSTEDVIRVGLVTGTATKPNVFPVFDLKDKTWSFDTPAQELGCMAEVEPTTGDKFVAQIGGGIDDGKVYQLNTGTTDNGTAIDSYVDIEVNGQGQRVILDEMVVITDTETGGSYYTKFYKNGSLVGTKTLSTDPQGAATRRHRFYLNYADDRMLVRLQHNTSGDDITLLEAGLGVTEWQGT